MTWISDTSRLSIPFTRKIVEIAAGTPPYSGLFARCNDGSIWELIAGNQTWRRCADIPQDADTEDALTELTAQRDALVPLARHALGRVSHVTSEEFATAWTALDAIAQEEPNA